jgi:uncharacterized protein YyaL (SSP411 family)
MTQSKTQELPPVVANLVADSDRLSFLPTVFGPRLMIRGEALVFGWLDRLSEEYNGGYWHFYTLTNGGFYLAPSSDTSMRISVEGNGFDGEMSADAAGIIATFFALSQLTDEVQGTEAGDTLIDRYFFLRDFAAEHVEARLIFRAID